MVDSSKSALILFVRNPILGKVKTRLAKSIGDERALEIYNLLLSHTHEITYSLNCSKFIYYADEVTPCDIWSTGDFIKKVQSGIGLGEKMHNAFLEIREAGFQRILIIGSDCYELTTDILLNAFTKLEENDAVIGPTFDGGYYLLGLKQIIPELFKNKNWSTNTVCKDTKKDLKAAGASYILLPVLNDVDEEDDIFKSKMGFNKG